MRFAPIGALVGLLAGTALIAMWQLGDPDGDTAVTPDPIPETPTTEDAPAHLDAPPDDDSVSAAESDAVTPTEDIGPSAGSSIATPQEREVIPYTERRIHGRLIDLESDVPPEQVLLWLQGAPQELPLALTYSDAEGKFSFSNWDGEARSVTCQRSSGWLVEEPTAVSGPPWDGAEVLVYARRWPPPSAGNISGRLVTESGEWSEADHPALGSIVLDLVSVTRPRISRRGELVFAQDGSVGFLFEEVPEGNYELTLSTLDSLRWTPQSLPVTPPAEGIEFLRYDQDDALPIVFRVFDAESKEPIEDFDAAHLQQTVSAENGVFMHAGPLESESFAVDAGFRWSLWSRGYAPAFGDQSAFRKEDGKLVTDVFLEPGWARRFVVLGPDPTMRPLAGAELLLDGESMGTTAADGSLTVQREAAPETIDVRFRDWVLSSTSSSQDRTSDRVRGYTTALVVRPPEED
jgi:hypothetical protein